MAGLKQTIIRGGLESLYFTGAHIVLRPFVAGVGAILTLASRSPAAAGPVPAQSPARSDAALSYARGEIAAPVRARFRQPRRNASPHDRRRFFAPLRLPDLRRRLSRHAAMGLSDPQGSRRAVSRFTCRRAFRTASANCGGWFLKRSIARNIASLACRSTAATASSTAARVSARSGRSIDELYWWLRAPADRSRNARAWSAVSPPITMSISRPSAMNCA